MHPIAQPLTRLGLGWRGEIYFGGYIVSRFLPRRGTLDIKPERPSTFQGGTSSDRRFCGHALSRCSTRSGRRTSSRQPCKLQRRGAPETRTPRTRISEPTKTEATGSETKKVKPNPRGARCECPIISGANLSEKREENCASLHRMSSLSSSPFISLSL